MPDCHYIHHRAFRCSSHFVLIFFPKGHRLFAFGHCTLDPLLRELRHEGTLVAAEPRVFDLIEYLIRHRDRVVGRDELIASVWNGRVVSDSTIAVRINAARRAMGDSGEDQLLIRTFQRKGFRFVGEVESSTSSIGAPSNGSASDTNHALPVHFCRTNDGVNIATASAGVGLPLVRTSTWLNHLESELNNPIRKDLLHALADQFQLIRYDGRGNGLSDREVADVSFEGFSQDLDAVVSAWKLDRYALLGMSQGAPIALAHAVKYPQRVSKLVLHGGFTLGRNKRASRDQRKMGDAMATLLAQGWGQEGSVFMRMYSSAYMPDASPEQLAAFAQLQQSATTGEMALRIRAACDDIDVRDLLAQVRVPTLVMHSRNDHVQPFDEGRRMATEIPGAAFIELDSENHVPMPGEPAWERFTREMLAFLQD
jgi:pimeloyl-ACP methyl ester carboxylesterase/DNA-binding winged helix-turn-helix (wHTH) protein